MAIVGAIFAGAIVVGQIAIAWWIGKSKGLYWLGYLWLTFWLGSRHPIRFQDFFAGILLWFALGTALYIATTWRKQTTDQRFSLSLGAAVVSVVGLAIYLLL